MKTKSTIELLEARIAPATLVDAHTVSYLDLDFDLVTVKISKGTFADPNVSTDDFTFTGGVFGSEQLVLLDLSNDASDFDGANVTFTVKRGFGDGFVNVGFINSFNHDLGAVTVKGDLGRIEAGNASATQPGLKSLNIRSMGRLGLDTQNGNIVGANIQGGLGALVVKGDIVNAMVQSTGAGAGIGPITIGGSLLGSGEVFSFGDIGAVKIGHDVRGRDLFGGGIHAEGSLARITIGGSLVGGALDGSNQITSDGDMGPVKIGHNVQGGLGNDSGRIMSGGKITSVTIGASLIGGDGDSSGRILSFGDMGPVKIGHNVQGGAGVTSGNITSSSSLASVTLGGSLLGGTNSNSGEIFSHDDMGPVKIGHDAVGGTGTFSGTIDTQASLASVTFGGSLVGGTNIKSGRINSDGDMGPVQIGRDVVGGSGVTSGRISSGAKLGSVTIGGSLIGGSNNDAGQISSMGETGAVKIGHDVLGGSGSRSGHIVVIGKLTSVTVGGSLVGGSGVQSGEIAAGGSAAILGPVKIGHDIQGGPQPLTGIIESNGKLGSVTIGGSLIGGRTGNSGEISSHSEIGPIKIGHDIVGANATGSDSVGACGFIHCGGRIVSVTIGGSIISGIDDSTGVVFDNAAIEAGDDIGFILVKGSLIGNETAKGFSPVSISARGQAAPGATADVAIGKITIGGGVEFARILAGYELGSNVQNADAQIGTVKVGGDWVASQLVAGAMNSASINQKFGDANDAKISGAGTKDTVGIISKIARITIGGVVLGTPNSESTTDHFGFVAEQIVTFKLAGAAIPLTLAAHNDNRLIGTTGDVNIHELT